MKPKANWTSLLKTKAHSFRELRWLSDLTWAGAVDGSIMTHIRHAEDPGAQQVLIGAVGRSIGRRPADERKQNNDGERAHPYDGPTAEQLLYYSRTDRTGLHAGFFKNDQTQGNKRVSFSSFRVSAALTLSADQPRASVELIQQWSYDTSHVTCQWARARAYHFHKNTLIVQTDAFDPITHTNKH